MKKNYIVPETKCIHAEVVVLAGISETSGTTSSDNPAVQNLNGRTESGDGNDAGAKFHHNWDAWDE